MVTSQKNGLSQYDGSVCMRSPYISRLISYWEVQGVCDITLPAFGLITCQNMMICRKNGDHEWCVRWIDSPGGSV